MVGIEKSTVIERPESDGSSFSSRPCECRSRHVPVHITSLLPMSKETVGAFVKSKMYNMAKWVQEPSWQKWASHAARAATPRVCPHV